MDTGLGSKSPSGMTGIEASGQMLRLVDKLWEKVLWFLMALAALYIGVIMLGIIYMTVFRTMGWPYEPMTFTVIEYGFVYILFLGSPWLIRTRGHVYIEMLTAAVPDQTRVVLSRAIAFIAAAVCFFWAWYTWQIFLEHWDDSMAFDELRAQMDIRLWVSTIAFPFVGGHTAPSQGAAEHSVPTLQPAVC